MSKRTWMWIGLGSVVLGVLLWLFPDIIVGWIVGGLGWWGGVDPTLRANAEQFAKTIGGIGTVVGALFTALNYLKSRSTPPKALSNTELEQHYYTHLSEQCQRYDLGSFRDSQSAAERSTIHVTLADVYVDLFAHEVSPLEENRDKRKQETHGGMRESKLLLEWLQDNSLNRLVVRGDVGSGKSSFINYLTHSIT